MEKTTCRNARIDLMRTIAMLMIVCGHFINHGISHITSANPPIVPFSESQQGLANFYILQFLGYATNIGTNIFFLITGYFLVKPRSIPYAISKSFRTWKVVAFYSVVIYALLTLSGAVNFSAKEFVSQIFPIHSRCYWFMSNYIVLVLLSPFMAKLLYNLSKREYQALLILLFCTNFGGRELGYGDLFSSSVSLSFDVALFAWGGYLKRFPLKEFKADYLLFFAAYIATCLALTYSCHVLQILLVPNLSATMHIRSMSNNSLPLLYATFFFLAATSRKYHVPAFAAKAAIRTSPYVLAVYLIHDNHFLRPILWDDIVKPLDFISSYWMVPYCMAAVAAIFAVCVLVEYSRQRLGEYLKSAALFLVRKLS